MVSRIPNPNFHDFVWKMLTYIYILFLDGQRGEWGIVPSKYKVDEELLKRNIDSDSELGMGIAGSGVSVAGKTLIFWRVISFLLKQPFMS
jgi:hypothetical protein